MPLLITIKLGVLDGTPISAIDILPIQHPQSEDVDIYSAPQMRNPENKGVGDRNKVTV